MIFNYDKQNGGISTVFSNKVSDISDETKNLLNLLTTDTDVKAFSTNELIEFCTGLDGASDSLLEFIKNGNYTGESVTKLKNDFESASKSTITFQKVTSKAKSAIKNIAGYAGSFALNGVVGALAGELASILIQLPTIDNKIQEALNSAASNAGTTVSNVANEIDQYKEQITGYLDVINDQSSSIDEVTTARQGLLSVQNELIDKFGSEASAAQAVTDAINGQVNALDKITQNEYFKQKDAFNKKDSWTNVRESWESGYTQVRNLFNQLLGNDIQEEYNPLSNMENMVNQMNSSYIDIAKTGNNAIDSLLTRLYDLQDFNGKFRISGNQMDILDTLNNISSITSKYDNLSKDFSSDLSEATSSVSSFVDANKELYNQYLLYEKILPNQDYKNLYKNLSDAKSEYDNALISGDNIKIQSAAKAYADYFNQIQDTTEALDYDVQHYLENMFPDMKSIVGKLNFAQDFKENADNIKSDLTDVAEALSSVTSNELADFNKELHTDIENNAYDKLIDLSKKYGLSISDLTTQMQEFGVMQSDQYRALANKFGIDNIRQLTGKDLEIAYKIENIGDLSFDELQQKIKETKQISENEIDIKSRTNLEAYQAAGEKPSHRADYDSYRSMMESAQELYEKGEVGDESFKAAAKAFSQNGMDDAVNWKENVGYLGQYFTEGSEGLEKFVKKLSVTKDASGEFFATWDDEAKSWNLNLSDLELMADKLGMPLEMLSVLLEGLQQYNFTNDYFGTMDDGVSHLTDLYTQLGEEQAKLAQMEADGITGTALDQQKEKVESLKQSIDTTIEGMNDLINMTNKDLDNQYKAAEAAAKSLVDAYNGIDWNSDSAEYQAKAIKEAIAQIEAEYGIKIKIDGDTASFDLSLEDIKSKVETLEENLDKLRDKDGKLNLDDSKVKEVYDELVKLRMQELEAENPIKLNIDSSSVQPEVIDVLDNLENRINKIKIDKELGLDTSKAEEELKSYYEDNKELLVALGIDDGSYESIKDELTNHAIEIPVEYSNTDLSSFIDSNGTASIDVSINNKDDIEMLRQSISQLGQNTQANITCNVNNLEQVDELQTFLSSRPNTTAEIYLEPIATPGFESKAMQLAQSMTPVAKVNVDAKGTVTYTPDTSKVDAYKSQPKDSNGKVKWENNSSKVDAYAAQAHTSTGTVVWGNNTVNVKTHFTALGTVQWNGLNPFGSGKVNGTAHVNGTAALPPTVNSAWKNYVQTKSNGAFIGGNWGIPYDQTALVGEVAPELLVRNGKWQLIGQNGTEFQGLKTGDIIFNHEIFVALHSDMQGKFI